MASKQKQKVLLMGKSGAGKSSMRQIIFSNYVAKDVRRLGATIDVETSRVKFLGHLDLNLWDCGGQDAFTDDYLTNRRQFIFNDVGVLIYVFEIESREVERDLATYRAVIQALEEYSPNARVFCLVHKMDLVQEQYKEALFLDLEQAIRGQSGSFEKSMTAYPTTIWDQSLYKAWASVVHGLIPNLGVIERYLRNLAEAIQAEEVILFERITFLAVMSVTTEIGHQNPYTDRFERLSNIIKTWKHSLAKFADPETQSHQFTFDEFNIQTPRFNLILSRLTNHTYVLVVLPPGEPDLNCARINIAIAREEFYSFDPPKERGGRVLKSNPQVASADGVSNAENN